MIEPTGMAIFSIRWSSVGKLVEDGSEDVWVTAEIKLVVNSCVCDGNDEVTIGAVAPIEIVVEVDWIGWTIVVLSTMVPGQTKGSCNKQLRPLVQTKPWLSQLQDTKIPMAETGQEVML